MATNYPTSKDDSVSLPNPGATDDTNSPSLAGGQDNQNSAIIAIETKTGTGSSNQAPIANSVLLGDGTGTSHWGPVTGSFVSSTTGTGAFVLANSATTVSQTLTTPVINNPTLKVDSIAGFTTSTTVAVAGVTINAGAMVVPSTSTSAIHLTNGGLLADGSNGAISGVTLTATNRAAVGTTIGFTAGGNGSNFLRLSSTSTFGIFWGSGVPTITAAQGSLYLRSDGSSTSTRMYINTTGSTTWTNVTTAA